MDIFHSKWPLIRNSRRDLQFNAELKAAVASIMTIASLSKLLNLMLHLGDASIHFHKPATVKFPVWSLTQAKSV